MEIINIEKSNLIFIRDYVYYVKDYYNYIVDLIKKILEYNNYNINILLDYNYKLDNTNKNINIGINFEHTLVKKGGRCSDNYQIGNIDTIDKEDKYLVRIDNYDNLIKKDIIIDYSIPNLININESQRFNDYYNKNIYIAAILYKPYFNLNNRNINLLTTFININEPRRFKLLENIKNENINHININNCFEKEELKNLYKNTKILINIHQTDHHHTFEELRVLPALLNGVIVIAEESPLYEHIMYNKQIIWSSYNNILNIFKQVENNYEYYYNNIFNDEFLDIIKNLENNNINCLNNRLKELSI